MTERRETAESMVRSVEAFMAEADAILAPSGDYPGTAMHDAETFYTLVRGTLNRRGCVGRPFGSPWGSMTNSARAIWVEAMMAFQQDAAMDAEPTEAEIAILADCLSDALGSYTDGDLFNFEDMARRALTEFTAARTARQGGER